ncbi:hypothetical protein [Plebeiibacterium sediminum]|uniref:Uncharacterized protein n=1 Tax=Plebeiibacterium sediminum TaxID=2992112 RepID=A0AAE3MA05_9BACT|nr:hypothetical protein [Plebeiobacterium sediminum]MCW3789549.1 hypothetical protein [Plebeiobacterium sediminum]
MEWINELDFEELKKNSPHLALLEVQGHNSDLNLDEFSNFHVLGGKVSVSETGDSKSTEELVSKTVWNEIVDSLLTILCAPKIPKELKELKKLFDNFKGKTTTTIVSILASAIAVKFGIAMGAATGIVSTFLGFLAKLTMVGFCKAYYKE